MAARLCGVARGAVPDEDEGHRVALGVLLPQELGDAARDQRRHACVGADRRRLPEPHLGEAPVAGERLGQHDLAVVARRS